ncbi:MAG: hypothetical protein GY801_30640, partial [bacterium]|nr:hypothetical protein [bacterium]
MTRMIYLSIFLLLLTISASAEERHLQAVVPGEAGTIALRATLDEALPSVMQNYSVLVPAPAA